MNPNQKISTPLKRGSPKLLPEKSLARSFSGCLALKYHKCPHTRIKNTKLDINRAIQELGILLHRFCDPNTSERKQKEIEIQVRNLGYYCRIGLEKGEHLEKL